MASHEVDVPLPEGVRLQLLPPRSRRIRNHIPEWDVWFGSARIGHIRRWSVRSSSSVFFQATAVHPETGAPIPLESSTDLEERINKVLAAWHEPDRFIHNWSWD